MCCAFDLSGFCFYVINFFTSNYFLKGIFFHYWTWFLVTVGKSREILRKTKTAADKLDDAVRKPFFIERENK